MSHIFYTADGKKINLKNINIENNIEYFSNDVKSINDYIKMKECLNPNNTNQTLISTNKNILSNNTSYISKNTTNNNLLSNSDDNIFLKGNINVEGKITINGEPISICSNIQRNNLDKPTTQAPTYAPTTYAPTTYVPTTQAPTYAPTTYVPTSQAPTYAPTTYVPTTQAPTYAPTTYAPTSQAPTYAPTTYAPTSQAPTYAPTTMSTYAPTTMSTYAPTTQAQTYAPTTQAQTYAPTTQAQTYAPTTRVPTTQSQTYAPTTYVPTSQRPTTYAPTTYVPTTTQAPVSDCPENIKTKGIYSNSTSGGLYMRLFTKNECDTINGNSYDGWIPGVNWNMKNDKVGECLREGGGSYTAMCSSTDKNSVPPSKEAISALDQ